jgi:hypothetical protein
MWKVVCDEKTIPGDAGENTSHVLYWICQRLLDDKPIMGGLNAVQFIYGEILLDKVNSLMQQIAFH